jgi:thymidylate synthase
MEESQKNGGNSTSALAKLLSQVNLPTLALVLLTGGGNFFATEQNAQLNRHEIQKAIDEIHRIFENQQRREQAYQQIDEINRIVKELKTRDNTR